MCAVRIIYLPSVYLSISRLSISIYPRIQLYLSISRFMISIYLHLLYVSVYQSYIRSSQDSRVVLFLLYYRTDMWFHVRCQTRTSGINFLVSVHYIYTVQCTLNYVHTKGETPGIHITLFTNIYSNLSDAVFSSKKWMFFY